MNYTIDGELIPSKEKQSKGKKKKKDEQMFETYTEQILDEMKNVSADQFFLSAYKGDKKVVVSNMDICGIQDTFSALLQHLILLITEEQ